MVPTITIKTFSASIHVLFIFVGAFIIYVYPEDNGLILWGLWGVVFCFSILFEKVSQKKFDAFSPIYILTIAFMLAFWVGAIRYINSNAYDVNEYIYYAFVAYNCFCIGFLLSKAKQKKQLDIHLGGVNRQLVIWGALIVAVIASSYMVAKVGIPALYDDKFTAKLEARELVSSYVIYLIRVAQFSIYFALAHALVCAVESGKRVCFSKRLWFAMFILSVVVGLNFLPGWRGPIILILFSCLLIWHYLYKKITLSMFVVLSAVGFLVVFGWGFWRIVSSVKGIESLSYINTNNNIVWIFFEWVSYQFSAYFLGLITVVDNFSSSNYLGFAGVYKMTWMTILPGKQDTFGEMIKDDAGFLYEGGGLNPTIIGESYADLGIISLIGYMLIFGWFIGKIYKNMILNERVLDVIMYAYILPVFTIGVFTGVLAQASYSFHFLVLLIVTVIMKYRIRFH